MAPKKRETGGRKAAPPLSPRRTRSRTAAPSADLQPAELPPAKKPKLAKENAVKEQGTPTSAGKAGTKKKMEAEDALSGPESVSDNESSLKEDEEKARGPAKTAKKSKGKKKPQPEAKPSGPKTIVIEACKQCQSFKRTAEKVKKGLEDGLPDVVVKINPDKPRRGCFEVREESGQAFVSLLDMPRPFKKMKDLILDDVVSDIITKIK